MRQHAQLHSIVLISSGLSSQLQRQLEGGDLYVEGDELFHIFPDLDGGVEWCERQILAAAGAQSGEMQDLRGRLEQILGELGRCKFSR